MLDDRVGGLLLGGGLQLLAVLLALVVTLGGGGAQGNIAHAAMVILNHGTFIRW